MQELMIDDNNIKDKIYTIINQQVMLDRDLGKKWFAFSKFEIESFNILERLK